MSNREDEIRKASWIAISGNAFLSVIKIVAGIIAGSLAVVADGVDSFGDIITSTIILITANILSRPPDKKYPYGYGKADTIATKALSFIIFFAGAQLFITAIRKLSGGVAVGMPSKFAFYIVLVSIAGKILLAIYQFRIGKRTGSAMLIANGKNMQNDVIISASVLLGLIFVFVFKLPVLDSITALLVSIWVLKVAFQIFMQTNVELMDGTKDCSIYNKIFDAIEAVEGVHHPHRVRSRNIGHKVMINIDLEVDGDLTLREAHELAHKVEDSIKTRIDNVFDVAIHVEPLGDKTAEEKYGITKSHL
ncbi:MAG: cation transporter [Bacteroidales bacterium]|nr:cation transporter [Bacteroidales bacterium]